MYFVHKAILRMLLCSKPSSRYRISIITLIFNFLKLFSESVFGMFLGVFFFCGIRGVLEVFLWYVGRFSGDKTKGQKEEKQRIDDLISYYNFVNMFYQSLW